MQTICFSLRLKFGLWTHCSISAWTNINISNNFVLHFCFSFFLPFTLFLPCCFQHGAADLCEILFQPSTLHPSYKQVIQFFVSLFFECVYDSFNQSTYIKWWKIPKLYLHSVCRVCVLIFLFYFFLLCLYSVFSYLFALRIFFFCYTVDVNRVQMLNTIIMKVIRELFWCLSVESLIVYLFSNRHTHSTA